MQLRKNLEDTAVKTKERKKVVILGAGGHARSTLWVFNEANEESCEWDVLGFIDENEKNHGKLICDLPVLGGFEWFDKKQYKDLYAICSVGLPRVKRKLVNQTRKRKLKFCSIIHPSVRMSKYVEVGEGTIISAGSILTTMIKVGNHVILNLDCTVGHDSNIADYCTIAPGVHISGNVRLEEGVELGTGTVTVQGISVGAWSVVSAGSVVISDIPAGVVAVGVPAKIVKKI